ncbi:unnamed protein product [Natator depressus]
MLGAVVFPGGRPRGMLEPVVPVAGSGLGSRVPAGAAGGARLGPAQAGGAAVGGPAVSRAEIRARDPLERGLRGSVAGSPRSATAPRPGIEQFMTIPTLPSPSGNS